MEAQLRRLGPQSNIKVLRREKNCSSKVWLCGRGTSCEIYTKSKYASRHHFSITYKNCEYYITDLNSANGTFLNDQKITGEEMLTFGSTISVGVPFEMFNSPDCIVYKFEPAGLPIVLHSSDNLIKTERKLTEDEICLIKELKKESESIKKCISDILEQLRLGEISRKTEVEDVLVKCLKAKNGVKVNLPSKEGTSEYKIHLLVEPTNEDVEKTVVNERTDVAGVSSSSEIVVIKESSHLPRLLCNSEGPTPAKMQRVENRNEGPAEITPNQDLVKIEDLEMNEAETEVSPPERKNDKPNLLNYSQVEDLIEIDDVEETEWVPTLKVEDTKFDPDEDDEVVFLQTIIKPPKINAIPSDFKIEDDFTDTDRKWLEKLLRVKEEKDLEECSTTSEQGNGGGGTERSIVPMVENENRKETFAVNSGSFVSVSNTNLPKAIDTLPTFSNGLAVATPKNHTVKKKGNKKVRFNLTPEVKYFVVEVTNPKLSRDIERGRHQFVKIIYNLCNWNTQWLKECDKFPADVYPPGLSDHPCRKVRDNYLNHAHYMFTFVPNIILQLWEKVREKCINSYNFFRQTVAFDGFTNYPSEKLTLCRYTGLVQTVPGHRNLLREGHLVILHVHQISDISTLRSNKYSGRGGYLIFGFIESKTYEKYTNQKIHPKLEEKTATLAGEFHLVRLEIFVKMRPNLKVDKDKLVQITVLHQISSVLRMCRGICCLPQSPLCNALLKVTSFKLPEPTSWKVVFKGPLSIVQQDVVLRLNQGCFSLDSLIYSIHGAAGTGKSHVVIALIWQLLFSPIWSDKRPKIIYCTQDGTPLDDMVLRLKNSISDQGSTFNLVRASYLNSVKPEVKELCLSVQSRKPEYKDFIDCEDEVLKKADVICTSCTSSIMSRMITVFGKRNTDGQKMVCIIDEAVSTRETECVIPLLFGVTHLILVGDIYQTQPSCSSKTTLSLRVDIPLFLRIYDYLKNNSVERERPFFILRTQYRINSRLSKFLNKHVYTSPFIVPEANNVVSLVSLLLLVDEFQTTDKIKKEKHENLLMWRLVEELMEIQSLLRYAVVTCSEEQSQKIKIKLIKSKFTEVEVNQVEEFQGQEFDVVLFLYDGSDIHPSKIATAITRARSSLFIVSLGQSINANSWFRLLFTDAVKNNFLRTVHPYMDSDTFKHIFTA